MKSTGIVRKIDELGRVVLPKELRATLAIEEKDPLEIYINNDEIILKKYKPNLERQEVTRLLRNLVEEQENKNAIDSLKRAIKLIN